MENGGMGNGPGDAGRRWSATAEWTGGGDTLEIPESEWRMPRPGQPIQPLNPPSSTLQATGPGLPRALPHWEAGDWTDSRAVHVTGLSGAHPRCACLCLAASGARIQRLSPVFQRALQALASSVPVDLSSSTCQLPLQLAPPTMEIKHDLISYRRLNRRCY
jgi:hypothetical protein